MASIRMMQGDEYSVFVALKINNEVLTPDMVSDVEICVGDVLRKKYSSGQVFYDEITMEWYFRPSQRETLFMEPETYEVQARVKFRNGEYSAVKGVSVGRIEVLDASSEEEL